MVQFTKKSGYLKTIGIILMWFVIGMELNLCNLGEFEFFRIVWLVNDTVLYIVF